LGEKVPKVISHISAGIEGIAKKTKIFKDIWSKRIDYAITQLISARLFYGKPHEGEMGLAIAKFVKETWRSISAVNKLEKLSKSDMGRAYIAKMILDNVPDEKRGIILSELAKLRNAEGLEFVEGVKKILERNLSREEYTKLDNVLGRHLAHAIVSGDGSAIFDPISSKLYYKDFEGIPQEKTLDLRKPDHVLELLSFGLLDKKKDLYSEFAEWRMLKIVEEGEMKGLKGKDLGVYVHARLREELEKDPHFFECFKYYIAKHINNLEKSRAAMVAFGDLIVAYAKLQQKMAAVVARAVRNLPFGYIIEPAVALAEGIGDLGDKTREAAKKRSEIKLDLWERRPPGKQAVDQID